MVLPRILKEVSGAATYCISVGAGRLEHVIVINSLSGARPRHIEGACMGMDLSIGLCNIAAPSYDGLTGAAIPVSLDNSASIEILVATES